MQHFETFSRHRSMMNDGIMSQEYVEHINKHTGTEDVPLKVSDVNKSIGILNDFGYFETLE